MRVEGLWSGIALERVISRGELEEWCAELFESLHGPLRQVLHDTGLEPGQVDDVVLVGGTTRMPRVRRLVSDFFGREPWPPADPRAGAVSAEEAIAHGAAVQASILCGSALGGDALPSVVDVTPLSLGIHRRDDMMSVILPRRTTIPCRAQKVYTTERDNQETVHIRVYEGERPFTSQNRLLGSFRLRLPPAPRRTLKVVVSFEVDADGVLSVSAEERGSERRAQVVLECDRGRLSTAAIDAMLREAATHSGDDAARLARSKQIDRFRTELDDFDAVLRTATGLSSPAREQARAAIDEGREWVRTRAAAATVDDAQRQRTLLAERCRGLAKAKRRNFLERLLS